MNRFKIFKIFCFILSIAAAVYYPVQKVIQYEFSPAEIFDFKVTGRDPYDPARGHFLALTVHPEHLTDDAKKKSTFPGNYAVLEHTEDGFTTVTALLSSPDESKSCIRLPGRVFGRLRYPFERFYVNEKIARKAEKIFVDAVKENKRCAVRVNVYSDGASTVEDLLIDGVSIRTLAAKKISEKK